MFVPTWVLLVAIGLAVWGFRVLREEQRRQSEWMREMDGMARALVNIGVLTLNATDKTLAEAAHQSTRDLVGRLNGAAAPRQ